jgi:uncharacterized protein (TIGR03790 family)
MRSRYLFALVVLVSLSKNAFGLGPNDVWLVANRNVPQSRELAEYYCKKRGVPKDHIIVLDLPREEEMSRQAYDTKLAEPLRKQLRDLRDKVKVLFLMYGVPSHVGGDEPTADDKKEMEKVINEMAPLQKRVKELQDEIDKLQKLGKDEKSPEGQALIQKRDDRGAVEAKIRPLELRRRRLSHSESRAAVDSELALLWQEPYDLYRWQINLLNFQVPESMRKNKPPMLMTCRLDGPNVALLKKIIDTSMEVESVGLKGKVYVDARGIKYNPKEDTGFGYGGYDQSLREMAKLLEEDGTMDVTLDDKPELFKPGTCTDCALYCGWYSHAKYVDCCRFVPGAVAWHIASSEAISLRDPKCTYWCKNLLEAGAVATLGPVAEPYSLGFPKPEEFFGFLTTGEFTLVESYWRSQTFASWMMVLVGDPLYNPYAKTPKLKVEQVKPSPEGGDFKSALEVP